YLIVFIFGLISAKNQMLLALVAYASYIINAMQFLFKLRMARLQADQINIEKSDSYGVAQ
ncbi:MAG: 2-vinyl bacteriochlorophyllide hydratase, partial [Pseudomonadota bacterium]